MGGSSGGGGGGGGDSKITQVPWEGAQNYLVKGFQRGNDLYENQTGFNPWASLDQGGRFNNFGQTMGFNPSMANNAYGIDPGVLSTAATTGVTPLNAMQRAGQQRMVDIANQGTTSGAAQAQQYLGRGMALGDQGATTMASFAGGAGNVYGNPYFDTQTNLRNFENGSANMGQNPYLDRTQQALTGAAEGQWLDRANANPFMGRQEGALNQLAYGQNAESNPYLGRQEKTLTDTAYGGFLNANPYLEGQYDAAARGLKEDFATSTLPALAAQFSGGGGAHGSPDHQYWAGKAGGDLMDTLGDMRSNMYGQNYQAERDRMLNAGNTLQSVNQQNAGLSSNSFNAMQDRRLSAGNALQGVNQQNAGLYSQNYQSERGNMLGAAGQLQGVDMQRAGIRNSMTDADLNRQFGAGQALLNRDMTQMGQWSNDQQQNMNRQFGAGQQLAANGYTASGQMQGLDNTLYGRQLQGAQLLGQAGDMDYNMANQLVGTAQQRYDQMQMAPWQRLGAYTSNVYGNPAAGLTGQQSMGGDAGGGSQFGQAAGGAISGAAAGSMFGPYGAAIGGGLGLASAFF